MHRNGSARSLLIRSQTHIGCRPLDRLGAPAGVVHVIDSLESSAGNSLDVPSAEPGNDIAPLPNRGGTDTQRPRDIRGVLKVINNRAFEHEPRFTTVARMLQPQFQDAPLTLVAMDKLPTIAARLDDAMQEAKVNASELARACRVSPAAVYKWLKVDGKLSADNLAAASRALGVSEEWLRTGKLPRERVNGTQEQDLDRVMDLLEGLAAPLAALAGAIEQLRKSRPEAARKGRRA